MQEWSTSFPEVFYSLSILLIVLVISAVKSTSIRVQVLTGILVLYITAELDLLANAQIFALNKYVNDSMAYMGTAVFVFFAIQILVLKSSLLQHDLRYTPEFIILVLLSVLGMLCLIRAADMVAMYLSIELQSLSMYVLAAYSRTSRYGTESGLKYYVMGSLMSAIQLLGIATIYGQTGTTSYADLYYICYGENNIAITCGLLLVIIGFLFKLGAVPFHMWLPDVYHGSPLASTAFFSIAPKLVLIIGLYRILSINIENIPTILYWISGLSLLIGTLQALGQNNIKRLLAYSGISHVGWILIGISTSMVYVSVFYVLIYLLMNVIIFGILTELKLNDLNKRYFNIKEFSNMSYTQPVLGVILSTVLFSMAGIPPLAGFYSKYYILVQSLQHGQIILSLIAILASALAAVYYIKIIQLIYFKSYNVMADERGRLMLTISNLNALQISIMTIIISSIFIKQEVIITLINKIF